MPPKPSPNANIVRLPISDSSLIRVPEDALEGFQERIETGIDWTLITQAIQYHKKLCSDENKPTVTFSEALETKIQNSIFGDFLKEESGVTLQQQWELLLPITLWDNEMFGNEERKICFHNANNVTDDMVKMIKKAVRLGDREVLRNGIKMVNVLRVTDSKMTKLDESLSDFKNLLSLSLCGNFIQSLDATLIPPSVRSIELQANGIKFVHGFVEQLPQELLYLGLARNCLNDDSFERLSRLPLSINVLDLSDNDIFDLEKILDELAFLPNLTSLMLAGNPCSVCMAYARITLSRLPRLRWLDLRKILPTDRSEEPFLPHPDDTRSSYFYFTIFRVLSAAQPPKQEKGNIATFHVELEIPLLDSKRRNFLMFRNNKSLIEMLPPPEDYEYSAKSKMLMSMSVIQSKIFEGEESSFHESDIYKVLTTKNSLEIHNFTTFESNRVQWSKIMNFTEPAVKIFCPDLFALRDTFRTVITLRLVYTLMSTAKPAKQDKDAFKIPAEQRLVLATIKCALKQPDWSQPSQHFHWDDSLGTSDALHWGEGDLSVLQYELASRPVKTKPGEVTMDTRQHVPDNLTCHFGFGIDTIHP